MSLGGSIKWGLTAATADANANWLRKQNSLEGTQRGGGSRDMALASVYEILAPSE